MFLSGWASASRLHEVELGADRPGRAGRRGLDGLDDELRRADEVGLGDHLVAALGVHQDLDAGDGRAQRRRRPRSVNRPCTEQCPFHRIIRASRSCSGVRPPPGCCGFQTTQSSRAKPSSQHGGVAAEVLVGQEQHLGVRSLLREGPLQRGLGVGRGADRAAVAAAERLDVGRGVHVGDRHDDVGDAGVGQRVPGVLDLGEPAMSAIEQPAARSGRIDLLLRRGEDVGRLGHEVHAAEDDVLRLRPRGRVAGELERVAGDVGELDDLVALVVVPEHEHLLAERLLGRGARAPPGRGRRRPAGRRGTRRRARRRGRCPGRGAAAGGRRSVMSRGTSLPSAPAEASRQDGCHRCMCVCRPGQVRRHADRRRGGRGDRRRAGRVEPRTTSSCRCRCPTAGPGSSTCSTPRWAASCVAVTVTGPYGEPMPATVLRSGDTAYVESAQAVGLHLTEPEHRDPERATTRGLGELLGLRRRRGAPGWSSAWAAPPPTTAAPGCSSAPRCHGRGRVPGAGAGRAGAAHLRRAGRGPASRARASSWSSPPTSTTRCWASRRHQDLRAAEGAARGTARHRRCVAAALRRAHRPQARGDEGCRCRGRAGVRPAAARGHPPLRCRPGHRGGRPGRAVGAPTSWSPAREPSTSPRAPARSRTASPRWRRSSWSRASRSPARCWSARGRCGRSGVESAYSVVDLVGEERALERPGGGAGGARHPDSPDLVPLTRCASTGRSPGREPDHARNNRRCATIGPVASAPR